MSSVALTVAAALVSLPSIGMHPSTSLPWSSLEDSPGTWDLVDPTMDLPADALDAGLDDSPGGPVAVDGCELTLDWELSPPPSWQDKLWASMPLSPAVENGHTEKSGRWIDYEQIPLRTERPESYLAYRYPVVGAEVVSGYDLDKPDSEQRRGTMNAVGHGGVDLAAPKGTPVEMLRLVNQVGDAEVLHVGWLFGETVVTRNTVREGGKQRDYLLLFGHLDGVAVDVRRGKLLPEGAIVGLVGDSGSPEKVHLHFEARRGRDGVDLWKVAGDELNAREYSIVTNPRNVLPLAFIPRRPSKCLLRPATTLPHRHWLGDGMTLTVDLPPGPTWRPQSLL